MNISFIGFGDLGVQIKNMLIEAGYDENKFTYFDDFLTSQKNGYPFEQYIQDDFADSHFVICLGYKHLKLKHLILTELVKKGRNLLTFIHKTAYVSLTAKIGKGVIIYPMSNIDYKCEIGDGSLINNSVTISHESQVGRCCFLAPGVNISGKVKIGDYCFIGTGTNMANNIEVGANSTIGIGSNLTKNIPPNTNGIGNPFRILNKNLKIQ